MRTPSREPLTLPATTGTNARPAAQLVFFGTSEVTTSAWVVENGPSTRPPRPVWPWPAGVHVVDARAAGRGAVLTLETRAVLDQPAGIRSVAYVVDEIEGRRAATSVSTADFMTSASALRDAESFARSLRDDAASPFPYEDQPVARCRALVAAARSPRSLVNAIATDGLDVITVYQPGVTTVTHHDRASAAALFADATLLSLVQHALTRASSSCHSGSYDSYSAPRGDVETVVEGNRLALRQILRHPRSAEIPARTSGTPRSVPARDTASPLDPADAARFPFPRLATFEAPLTTTGDSSIAVIDFGGDALWSVLREDGTERMLGIQPPNGMAEDRAATEARFADLDGDGRTDLVLGLTYRNRMPEDGGTSDDTRAPGPPTRVRYLAFITPPATTSMPRSVSADLALAFPMLAARNIDEAVRLALAEPRRGVPLATGCSMFASAHTLAGLRRVATRDARFLEFEEPGDPTYFTTQTALSAVTARQFNGGESFTPRCSNVTCRADRPYCALAPVGPQSWVLWFDVEHGAPRIRGFAGYIGS